LPAPHARWPFELGTRRRVRPVQWRLVEVIPAVAGSFRNGEATSVGVISAFYPIHAGEDGRCGPTSSQDEAASVKQFHMLWTVSVPRSSGTQSG